MATKAPRISARDSKGVRQAGDDREAGCADGLSVISLVRGR